MMMQMLAAAGMSLLTDSVRAPDEDNPCGYFEFEPVKRTREDPSWVAAAIGKAVKIITPFLRDLPPEFDYRVILMRRDPAEVLASQKAMLARLRRRGPIVPDDQLIKIFQKELENISQWIASQPNFKLLAVSHHDCISNPLVIAASVAEFLDAKVDRSAMAEVIDDALYRKIAGRM